MFQYIEICCAPHDSDVYNFLDQNSQSRVQGFTLNEGVGGILLLK